ncbi:MAG: helicase, partial [Bacteroidetes bacterium]|nr:helicase [Bacteroidota bacterium]
ATLNVFRRVHHKLLTTGSVTLNHINELYPQLELMYNNSINFLCECAYIYRQNKEGEIKKESNPGYCEPFPAWRGNSLFKSCFCPSKTSVFGIKKFNQDLYNAEVLKEILAKSVLTRTFKDIVGENKYEIIPCYVQQNEAEKDVYRVIVEEFYRIVNDYFENTGNSRKESGLKIIRQIQLLIKSTSIPHLMKEYSGTELPGKYLKIFDLIQSLKGQKVALGTLYVKAARDYYKQVQNRFPSRPVFLILGNISFKKRKAIIEEFENTQDGILISTQASLSESVNIPSVDHCIIEAIQWNIPKIFQYAFRFIRFNSKNFKHIHFVTYEYTIEQNLLGLLMAKERLNEFIKTLEFREKEDIFTKYGLDVSLLDGVMEKEVDQRTGTVKLTWGQSRVS